MKYSALRRLVELQTGGKMKREVDFIAEFEKENAELKQEKTNPSPPTEEEYRKLWLSMKLVDLKKAQYQKTKIADYSEEIKELAAQIYSPQYLKHLNLNDDEDFI